MKFAPNHLFTAKSVRTIDFRLLRFYGAALDNDLTMNKCQGTLPSSSTVQYILDETAKHRIVITIATNSHGDKSALCRMLRCRIVQPGKWWLPRKNLFVERYIRRLEKELGLPRDQIFLIDDKLSNCIKFVKHGGRAIRVNPTARDTLFVDKFTLRQLRERLRLRFMNVPSIDHK